MKFAIALPILLLVVAHQDYWLWTNTTQVFGFLPAGLAWHVGVSLAAAVVWWWVTRVAWPHELADLGTTTKEQA